MAKSKTKITRTYGPIHFEDLDPHRFEDLVRELIYDYKDWRSIEATGRSGNDGGFDVRAYEKLEQDHVVSDEGLEEVHPMSGNLWMIQGKREKEIGPKRITAILADIDSDKPPYGYILAASANFSKHSYDVFREELRKKGVMEFYLWGKAELEDMLHLPKNDRILFTFFGVSLVSRRRSRATEIRQAVANKNKLFSILGEDIGMHKPILLRDSNDTKYPYKSEIPDFDTRPRWAEYQVVEYHPLGLVIRVREHYAYFDEKKKEYDYADGFSLLYRESDAHEDSQAQRDGNEKVEDYWAHIPQRHRAKYYRHSLIRYDDMLVIDKEGDTWNKFPHIFIDYEVSNGPLARSLEFLLAGQQQVSLKEYKRCKKFPASFPEQKISTVHESKNITLDPGVLSSIKHGDGFFALYAVDDRYDFLKIDDAAPITNTDGRDSTNYYLQITHIERFKVKDFLKLEPGSDWQIEKQIERKPISDELMTVYECKRLYDFEVERRAKKSENAA